MKFGHLWCLSDSTLPDFHEVSFQADNRFHRNFPFSQQWEQEYPEVDKCVCWPLRLLQWFWYYQWLLLFHRVMTPGYLAACAVEGILGGQSHYPVSNPFSSIFGRQQNRLETETRLIEEHEQLCWEGWTDMRGTKNDTLLLFIIVSAPPLGKLSSSSSCKIHFLSSIYDDPTFAELLKILFVHEILWPGNLGLGSIPTRRHKCRGSPSFESWTDN